MNLTVVVAERTLEADDIVALDLRGEDGGTLPAFEAGAHVDVEVTPGIVRQYSLCGDPARSDTYRLGVLLEGTSRGGSRGIHELRVGDRVRIGAPRNQFPLVEDAAHTILIGGGIGITPLIAMAHRLDALDRSFVLDCHAKTEARAPFRHELAKSKYSDRVFFHYDANREARRLSLESVLRPARAGTHVYTCGPTGFMEMVGEAAREVGYPAAQIHIEHFSAQQQAGGAFKVTLAQSGVTYDIHAGQSIAQVLKAAGLDVEVSCEQGMCGTCLVEVLEGTPDHRDIYQTDEEKAANTHMTICCSRAVGDSLVLDL